MRAFQGLLWEQWRQSRLWVVAAYAFLLLLTVAVILYRPWMLAQFYGDTYPLDKFAWAIGFTLLGMLFVNQRIGDISLYFPGRQFTLPCRTVPLVVSHLLYKSGVAILLGLLISQYQWLLLDEHNLSLLPVPLFLALVAVCQAVSMVAAAAGTGSAVASGAAGVSVALGCYYYLFSGVGFASDSEAALTVAMGTTVAGWGVSLACAPAARHGRKQSRIRWSMPMPAALRIPVALHLQWNFATSTWAHAWYEWRRVTGWAVRTVIPAAFLLAVWGVGEEPGGVAILIFGSCVMVASATCNYFLLRISSTEHRFLLSRPGGEKAVVDGKLLSALLASQCAAGATALVAVIAALVAILLGDTTTSADLLRAIPLVYLVVSGMMWIILTSASVYFFLFVAGFTLVFVLATPLTVALGLGVSVPIAIPMYLFGLTLLLYKVSRKLRNRGIPIPWELGLALLAIAPDAIRTIVTELYYFEVPLPGQVDDRVGFLLPTFLLLGGLFFSLRLKLLPDHRAVFAFSGHLILSAVVFAVYLWGYRLGPLTELDVIFFWVAACFAPIVWLPLAVRLQRYR